MTDEQIMQALKCCTTGDCVHCPRWKNEYIAGDCTDILPYAITLINRQKAEIDRLTVELDAMRGAANSYKMHYEAAGVETAGKIFAEIEEYRAKGDYSEFYVLLSSSVEKLKKKYTEGKTGINNEGEILIPMAAVSQSIARTPTEDVVKVVRCKDCVYRGTRRRCDGRKPDYYCADGIERSIHEDKIERATE